MTMKTTRRQLLSTAAKASAALAAGPTFLFPRKGRAASAAFGEVEHLLVLFAKGGFRSHCLFNAVGTEQHNPFGTTPALPGTEWALGGACDTEDYDTSLGMVPPLSKITNDIAVVPCVDHMPGVSAVDVGHDTGVRRICTGAPDGAVGLLSMIGKHHAAYANGFSRMAIPPVEIGPTDYGLGAKEYGETRPLTVLGAGRSFTANLPVGTGWKISAREALDRHIRERRSRAYRHRVSNFLRAKGYASMFADMLGDPQLDVLATPDASANGVTNAQLLDVLGNYSLMTLGDLQPMRSWGADVALALRFFGFGVPAVVVTNDIYDMHDDERSNFTPRTRDLGRQLAGLRFLLERMSHPKGGTFWDKTLVTVVSEFSRNNTAANGFNSGNGSDHVGRDAGPTRNQAIAFMGGSVTAGGKRIGATDEQMNATGEVFSSRSFLSTLLDVIGIDHAPFWTDEPIRGMFA